MVNIMVDMEKNAYPIEIGKGALANLAAHIANVTERTRCAVISNATVFELYGNRVMDYLAKNGFDGYYIEIPDSETAKSLEVAGNVCHQMLAKGLDRDSIVIALGGGVVGDLAGFVAATFMRGIPIIQVPTTLLAQVDSSIGGKCAVDHPLGKNLIGMFHQPLAVISDPDVLLTLAKEDLRSGMGEVIKYGMISDPDLFELLETRAGDVLARDIDVLCDIVERCSAIKANIVSQDEKDHGLRRILNFGHTFGHAVETGKEYRGISHGEAVAVGMVFATRLSLNLGLVDETVLDRLLGLLEAYDLPISITSDLKFEELLATMRLDKKAIGGNMKFVLPTEMGNVIIKDDITEDQIIRTMGEMRR